MIAALEDDGGGPDPEHPNGQLPGPSDPFGNPRQERPREERSDPDAVGREELSRIEEAALETEARRDADLGRERVGKEGAVVVQAPGKMDPKERERRQERRPIAKTSSETGFARSRKTEQIDGQQDY